MQFLRNLKQLNNIWKKAIICCLLVLVSLPLFWLIKRNLINTIESSGKQNLFESAGLDKLQQVKDSALNQMNQQVSEFEQAVKELQRQANEQTTSSISNSEISTTTN